MIRYIRACSKSSGGQLVYSSIRLDQAGFICSYSRVGPATSRRRPPPRPAASQGRGVHAGRRAPQHASERRRSQDASVPPSVHRDAAGFPVRFPPTMWPRGSSHRALTPPWQLKSPRRAARAHPPHLRSSPRAEVDATPGCIFQMVRRRSRRRLVHSRASGVGLLQRGIPVGTTPPLTVRVHGSPRSGSVPPAKERGDDPNRHRAAPTTGPRPRRRSAMDGIGPDRGTPPRPTRSLAEENGVDNASI